MSARICLHVSQFSLVRRGRSRAARAHPADSGRAGVVSALYDVPVGEVWPRTRSARSANDRRRRASVRGRREHSGARGHQARPPDARPARSTTTARACADGRDRRAGALLQLHADLRLDAHRSRTCRCADGSTTLAYDDATLGAIDLSRGMATTARRGRPATTAAALARAPRRVSRRSTRERLWEHLAYFLERVVPAAEAAGVQAGAPSRRSAVAIFGLPRIITDGAALERVVGLVDSPGERHHVLHRLARRAAGERPAGDDPRGSASRDSLRALPQRAVTGERQFHETPHPSRFGDVDMVEVLRALRDVGFAGPMRPDHGRMIWGETGRPGYGLYDRALGAMYLQGLWEGVSARARLRGTASVGRRSRARSDRHARTAPDRAGDRD